MIPPKILLLFLFLPALAPGPRLQAARASPLPSPDPSPQIVVRSQSMLFGQVVLAGRPLKPFSPGDSRFT